MERSAWGERAKQAESTVLGERVVIEERSDNSERAYPAEWTVL